MMFPPPPIPHLLQGASTAFSKHGTRMGPRSDHQSPDPCASGRLSSPSGSERLQKVHHLNALAMCPARAGAGGQHSAGHLLIFDVVPGLCLTCLACVVLCRPAAQPVLYAPPPPHLQEQHQRVVDNWLVPGGGGGASAQGALMTGQSKDAGLNDELPAAEELDRFEPHVSGCLEPPLPPFSPFGHAGNAWCLYPTLIADV